MTEQQMYRVMSIGALCLAGVTGLATVAFLIATIQATMVALVPAGICVVATIALVLAAMTFGERVKERKSMFANDVEREVLDPKQRRQLRQARGGLVMERALVDIENARQNIVHKQITDGQDPDKPPYQTDFDTVYPPVEQAPRISGGPVRKDQNWS